MNLNKEELEILSDCILSKMEELSKIKYVSKDLLESIRKRLKHCKTLIQRFVMH